MPFFVIYAEDKPGTLNARLEARPNHLARLKALDEASRLLVAGPCPVSHDADATPGFTGSVVIAEFATQDDAHAWANVDPYVEAGVYDKVTIKPYKPVLGSAV
jgi:uncharacterized protein YciI